MYSCESMNACAYTWTYHAQAGKVKKQAFVYTRISIYLPCTDRTPWWVSHIFVPRIWSASGKSFWWPPNACIHIVMAATLDIKAALRMHTHRDDSRLKLRFVWPTHQHNKTFERLIYIYMYMYVCMYVCVYIYIYTMKRWHMDIHIYPYVVFLRGDSRA
jgi:hypothetical protein